MLGPQLQQHLPFTVLKRHSSFALQFESKGTKLQQHLPFTVLKLLIIVTNYNIASFVATALTVYGIETD